ncbi:MAG: Flp pilus assembly protein CpaB [Elusimicrobiota bacterium]
MDKKRVLLISLVLGLVGVMLASLYLKKKEEAIVAGMNPVSVLVAKRDISQRTMLDEDMFKVEQIPEKYVEPKAILVKDTQKDLAKAVGMVNLVPITAGQQIMQSALVPPSVETGVSVKVPVGKRAMVIPLPNIDLTSLIKPGDKIDLLNTFTAQLKTGGSTKITVTVLQNVVVLGVAKDLGEVHIEDKKDKKGGLLGGDEKRIGQLTLSIAVTPEEAQLVALAQAQGDINVTIRARNDDEGVLVRAVDTSMFLK